MSQNASPSSSSAPVITHPSAAPVHHNPHVHAHHLKYGVIDHTDFAAMAVNERIELDKHREFERVDAHARRTHSERRYLFRRPRALQYFRGNTLVRDPCERTSGRLELFFDLTFVGLISVLAKECVEHPDGGHLVKYLLTYTPAFMVWTYVRELMNSFWNDDLQQRCLVLFVMIMLIVYGNNATSVEESYPEGPARATAVGAYLLATGAVAFVFLFYSFFVKPWRIQVRAHFLLWMPVLGLWIGVIFAKSHRLAIGLATTAMCLEYSGWLFVYSPHFKRMMNLHYSSAVAIEHEIDRFNDFFTLVMGEFLYSAFSNQPAGLGVHHAVGRAALALIVAFSIQLLYVGGSGCKKIVHPIRYSVLRADMWFNLHLPVVCALTIVGDSTADLIRENVEVEQGVRWIFCGGYAVAMLGIWGIAMLEEDKDAPGEIWFPMKSRLAGRVISALVVIFLPLASQETITSNKLLGIVAALSFATLLYEMTASLEGPASPAFKRVPRPTGADTTSEKPKQDGTGVSGERLEMWAQTFEWTGRPCFCEAGLYVPDRSHQRYRIQSRDPDDVPVGQ